MFVIEHKSAEGYSHIYPGTKYQVVLALEQLGQEETIIIRQSTVEVSLANLTVGELSSLREEEDMEYDRHARRFLEEHPHGQAIRNWLKIQKDNGWTDHTDFDKEYDIYNF